MSGAVRDAPWIVLRTPSGVAYFANLVSRETRWLPPHRWMEGWILRRPATPDQLAADQHPHLHIDEAVALDRTRMQPAAAYGRRAVEGGAPYLYTLRESKNPESSGEKAQKQHVGGQENREGPSGRWAGSPHTPRLPLAPALAAPHWSTSPRSSRAGIVTCVARVGGPPHCTVAI